jgi:HEAT repeat protein
MESSDPTRYVQENEEQLTRLLKHSNNDFVRSLALAALIEFGDDATVDTVTEDLEKLREQQLRE